MNHDPSHMPNAADLSAIDPHADEADRPNVSPAVIKRLPRYFRYLRELLREGKMRISSGELSALMNVTASQIRQDLNCFGGFGQQGYGYKPARLGFPGALPQRRVVWMWFGAFPGAFGLGRAQPQRRGTSP